MPSNPIAYPDTGNRYDERSDRRFEATRRTGRPLSFVLCALLRTGLSGRSERHDRRKSGVVVLGFADRSKPALLTRADPYC
jgi:hypothetical protein